MLWTEGPRLNDEEASEFSAKKENGACSQTDIRIGNTNQGYNTCMEYHLQPKTKAAGPEPRDDKQTWDCDLCCDGQPIEPTEPG